MIAVNGIHPIHTCDDGEAIIDERMGLIPALVHGLQGAPETVLYALKYPKRFIVVRFQVITGNVPVRGKRGVAGGRGSARIRRDEIDVQVAIADPARERLPDHLTSDGHRKPVDMAFYLARLPAGDTHDAKSQWRR